MHMDDERWRRSITDHTHVVLAIHDRNKQATLSFAAGESMIAMNAFDEVKAEVIGHKPKTKATHKQKSPRDGGL